MANKSLKPKIPKPVDDDEARSIESEELKREVADTLEKGVTFSDDEHTEYEMLCGYKDSDGVLHKTYTIREMTGRDEEAISKPEVKQNPTKAINVLLSRCVMSIGTLERKSFQSNDWMKIIQSLYSGDQDVMLMQLRKLSISDEIEVQHTCPNCKAKLRTILSVDELEIIPFKGETVVPFTLTRGYRDKKGVVHTEGTMRLANGLDREILTPLAKKNLARANTVLLTRLCKFNDGTYIDEDVMANLTVKDREYLNGILNDNAFGYDLSVDVECDQCGETFRGSLNMVNFLR